jgi:hypothetical protein
VVVEHKARASMTGILPKYHVKVRVKFDDGSSVEFKQELNSEEVGRQNEGAILPVRYDPSDHSKITIDVPAIAIVPIDRDARKAEAIARAEEQIAHTSGSGATATSANHADASGLPTDAEMRNAWATFQSALTDTSSMGAFLAARKNGDVAEQSRLRPLIEVQNAKVQALNLEYHRLSALRPDWQSDERP